MGETANSCIRDKAVSGQSGPSRHSGPEIVVIAALSGESEQVDYVHSVYYVHYRPLKPAEDPLPLLPQTRLRYAPLKLAGVLAD